MNLQMILGRVLLIYQMPKTASQTVEATLQQCSLPHRIQRLHFLSAENAADIKRCLQWKEAKGWKEGIEQLKILSKTSRALRLRRLLCACGAPIPKLEVITAVRDVLGAALSTIFENQALFVGKPELLTVEKCVELFGRPRLCPQFSNWPDVELQPQIGIDVYAKPFPFKAGFTTYESRFARVFLYRFESLPQIGPAMGDFLGARVGALVSRNLSDSKNYAQRYSQTKAQLRLPEKFVSQQLDTKFMRHFYSPEDRALLHLKWTGQPQGTTGAAESLAAASC